MLFDIQPTDAGFLESPQTQEKRGTQNSKDSPKAEAGSRVPESWSFSWWRAARMTIKGLKNETQLLLDFVRAQERLSDIEARLLSAGIVDEGSATEYLIGHRLEVAEEKLAVIP